MLKFQHIIFVDNVWTVHLIFAIWRTICDENGKFGGSETNLRETLAN